MTTYSADLTPYGSGACSSCGEPTWRAQDGRIYERYRRGFHTCPHMHDAGTETSDGELGDRRGRVTSTSDGDGPRWPPPDDQPNPMDLVTATPRRHPRRSWRHRLADWLLDGAHSEALAERDEALALRARDALRTQRRGVPVATDACRCGAPVWLERIVWDADPHGGGPTRHVCPRPDQGAPPPTLDADARTRGTCSQCGLRFAEAGHRREPRRGGRPGRR